MNPTTWYEAYEAFDNDIDEFHESVILFGIDYLPSRVLRKIDPIHYRTAFNDWADVSGINTDDLTGYDNGGN